MTQLHKILLLRLGCFRNQLDGIVDSETLDKAIASQEVVEVDGKLYAEIPDERVGIASSEDYVLRSKRSRNEKRESEFVYRPFQKGDSYRDRWERRE
jgi:hypothetical protein